MAAEVVITCRTGTDGLQNRLFEGVKFWLSQKVPQRSRFINDIKANGGEVLPIEKNADVKIVDHARKEALPGTHSYTYIEKSIRNGAIENLADHAVGQAPGAVRSIGSVVQPPKGTRQKYTQEDERILWDWVNTNPQKSGGTLGNEIYKQLEAKHPQHPWQSWRDHWVKSIKGKTRPIYPPNNAPPTPPSELPVTGDQSGPAERAILRSEADETDLNTFDEKDAEALLEHGEDILKVAAEDIPAAWTRWANEMDTEKLHTAAQWQAFWEQRVRSRFLKRNSKRVRRVATDEEAPPPHSVSMAQTLSGVAPPVESQVGVSAAIPIGLPHHPESPKIQATRPPIPSLVVQETETASLLERAEDAESPLGRSFLKRKRPHPIEEIRSSPPPQISFSPMPTRTTKRPREIASTPDRSPRRHVEKKQQSLFLEDVFEAEADEILKDSQDGGNSPLGQQPSESLSEPDRNIHPTQALFRENTTFIDFEVASPEGGWGGEDEDDGNNADNDESESQYDSARELPALPDTQAVLESTTQIPDLTIPEPDDPWDTLLPPSSPPAIMPSSPGAASDTSSVEEARLNEEIESFIEDCVAQGFSMEQTVMVLNSTCTDVALTGQVLQQMGRQQEGQVTLPGNVKGLWTEEDDTDLYSSDARKVGRLERKHGADKFNARYEWLSLNEEERG